MTIDLNMKGYVPGMTANIETDAFRQLPLDPAQGYPLTNPLPDEMRKFLWPEGQNCFALLDGAAFPNLPEMLETSGLPHGCLFQGEAAEDLGEVAPWLVTLADSNALTRSLFTDGDAPWQLWGSGPLLLLQSPHSLRQIRAHLRKFTRLKGTDGRHYFFRFWEAAYLEAFLLEMSPVEAAKLFDAELFSGLLVGQPAGLRRFRWKTRPARSMSKSLLMTPDMRTLFGYVAQHEFDKTLHAEHCSQGDMDAGLMAACLETARRNGFYARTVLRDYIGWCAQENANIMEQSWARAELQQTQKYRETLRFDRLRLTAEERA
ncbi:DUF4123 domain-containing protein [uncultured Litoreibacter sp.]|uniref:DUF4123 domain-containing protein n=2 Tax=uncultured Litoreibacter sp. TaxID=1392394 RepID=UPI002607FDEA|nr:DUF4123 domain-containing protein [uncultured Litoreibacter sp.]